jgi:hypothetical protein
VSRIAWFLSLALLGWAAGCSISSAGPEDAGSDARDAIDAGDAQDASDGDDAWDADGDDLDGGPDEAGDDGGPGDDDGVRGLEGTVLLGAGGFFGISGRVLGQAGGLGAGAFGVGAHYADLDGVIGGDRQAGRLYLFRGGSVPDALAAAAQVLEPPDGALLGGFAYPLGNPCDPDGDGQLDLPVASHLWSESAQISAVGRVSVFWADPQGAWDLTRVTHHRLSPALRQRSDVLGQTVLCVDVDGDGYDDLLAGGQNAGPADTGLVAIFRGSAAGLSANEDQTLVPPLAVNRQYLGASILWSDLTGDGQADLAVGGWGLVRGQAAAGPHTGGVLVWTGGEDWTAGPSHMLFPPGGDTEIGFGSALAVAEAGGQRFLLVGAPDFGAQVGPPEVAPIGAVFVYRLGAGGFPQAHEQVLVPPAGFQDVGFGNAFAFSPDHLGPGAGALLVGMKDADASPELTGTGVVAVFPLDGAAGRFAEASGLLLSPAPLGFDGFGQLVLPLGDLTGDGLQDFAIGIPTHIEGDLETGLQTGGVVIYH